MFARISSVIALALCASASVLPRTGGGSCNTGPVQCCNQVQSTSNPGIVSLAGLLGIALPTVDGLAGLNCNPISVIGLGGNSCSSQPVCCENNNFNGLIALGCTPVNLNL